MKNICLLIICFNSLVSLGQTPILTAIVDGDCSGDPKVLEIYANAEVDFSLYSLQNQKNGDNTWGNTQTLTALGTVTDGFAYITKNTNLSTFNTEFPSLSSANILVSNVIDLNGNDRIRIIANSTSIVIDQYGVEGVDGTGESWEYKDSYAKRIDGTGPDGGFVEANWIIAGKDALKGKGSCHGGPPTIESIMGGIGIFNEATAVVYRNEIPDFSMYPNPIGNGILKINTLSNSQKQIQIFNILGKQLLSKTITNEELNVSKLKAGMYILKVIEDGKTAIRKLVIK
jgi:hypothetical protein